MTKGKKILGALTMTLICLCTAFTFASDYTGTFNKSDKQRPEFASGQSMHQRMPGNVNGFSGHNMSGNQNQMDLERFIDFTGISDSDKESVKELIDQNRSAVKTLLDQLTGSITESQKSQISEQIQSLQTTFFASIRNYVASDKLEEYDAFVQNAKKMEFKTPGTNKNNTETTKTKTIKQQKQYLSEKTRNTLISKFEKLTDEKLQTIGIKIDSAILKIQNSSIKNKDKYLGIYGEIKLIVDDLLDADDTESEDILDDLLN